MLSDPVVLAMVQEEQGKAHSSRASGILCLWTVRVRSNITFDDYEKNGRGQFLRERGTDNQEFENDELGCFYSVKAEAYDFCSS